MNLLSSIIHALGGSSPHPRLKALDPRLFDGVSRVVYLVLDGVGYHQLSRFMAAGGGGGDDPVHRGDTCGARCAELASAPP